MHSRAAVAFLLCVCGAGCGPKVIILGARDSEKIRQSIRVGVENAIVHSDERIGAWTSIAIQRAPCDIAFEVIWLEFSSEPFGVIWAYRGENSNFQPVRMYLPADYPNPQDDSSVSKPPRELRTVDVLLRPSKLALDHADMAIAWEGTVLIEDVPLSWRRHPPPSATSTAK